MAYRTVIAGTDGSATAEAALRAAASLAAADGATLLVVAAYGAGATAAASRAEAQADADRGCDVAREVGVTSVAARTAEGAPAEALLAVADEVGADLVVVGSRGMTRPSRTSLGAVANTVTHHAGCDVLVFQTDG